MRYPKGLGKYARKGAYLLRHLLPWQYRLPPKGSTLRREFVAGLSLIEQAFEYPREAYALARWIGRQRPQATAIRTVWGIREQAKGERPS